MRKYVAFVVLLVFTNFSFAGNPQKSVVAVAVEYQNEQGQKSYGTGSGTIISNNDNESLVLTNKHVAKGSSKIFIIFEGKLYAGEIILVSDNNDDLAVFKVKKKIQAVGIADNDIGLNEEISHYGRASGPQKGKTTTLMKITNSDDPNNSYRVLTSDTLSIPGDSGAGMFDKDGILVAVNFGRMGNIENGSEMGVPVSSVKSFLQKIEGWKFTNKTPD